MRTSIELDGDLVQEALRVSGLTKRGALEEGLRLLIRVRGQASIKRLAGKIPLDIDLAETRRGRRR